MSHKKLMAAQEEARALLRNSIVEDAISRFITQILEVAAQRNADRIKALEAEKAKAEALLAETVEALRPFATALERYPRDFILIALRDDDTGARLNVLHRESFDRAAAILACIKEAQGNG